MTVSTEQQVATIHDAKSAHLAQVQELKQALSHHFQRLTELNQQEVQITHGIVKDSIVATDDGTLYQVAHIGCHFDSGAVTMTGIKLPAAEGAQPEPVTAPVRLATAAQKKALNKKPAGKKPPAKKPAAKKPAGKKPPAKKPAAKKPAGKKTAKA